MLPLECDDQDDVNKTAVVVTTSIINAKGAHNAHAHLKQLMLKC